MVHVHAATNTLISQVIVVVTTVGVGVTDMELFKLKESYYYYKNTQELKVKFQADSVLTWPFFPSKFAAPYI
jgi:hypothetical protein